MPMWYEWHWQKTPVSSDEQRDAKRHLMSIQLKKGVILELIGRWKEVEKIYSRTAKKEQSKKAYKRKATSKRTKKSK